MRHALKSITPPIEEVLNPIIQFSGNSQDEVMGTSFQVSLEELLLATQRLK